ncbi:GNAT family N-acetyltransferase [Priestia flexa]|nr:GNAT family N-acetyltransferase [Priestia flexa]MBN8435004.1 GNAT family N-acetyltransferase [Priestia flexa]MCA0967494.1 GNAT family N-acetyltransferase [Priestia flexa]RIV04880.1 GNAT family N-acetyltransferase [Priestia flexa]
MKYVIEKMTVNDIHSVQQVATDSWNHTYKGIIPLDVQNNFLRAAYSTEMLKKRMEESELWVALVETKVVGFANFTPVNEKWESELLAIYLLPDYQRKGIGTALFAKGSRHVKKVIVHVERENQSGMSFYRTQGFTVTDEFDEDFDGHLLQTVQMTLQIK